MYSTNYNWKSFDPLTAKLTVEVNVLWDGVIEESRDIRLTLPVDADGAATTDQGLVDFLIQDRIYRYFPDVVNNTRIPSVGVVNAQDVYELTSDIELGEQELVRGVIYNVLGQPVQGARVQSLASGLSGAVITDAAGRYSLPALADFETVSVSSATGSAIWPRQQTTAIYGPTTLDITVQLTAGFASVTTVTDADTDDNTVVNTGRSLYSAEVELPAGSIVDSNGDPVTDVVVAIANNVVSDASYANVFPGFFLGDPLVGSVGPIESFGFMEIRVSDPAGIEEYTLDPAVGATIFIPVNPDPVGVNSIPLWRLDDATGIWEETGTATRVGSTNVFEADVTSFSTYNLDRPLFETVTLTVTAYDDPFNVRTDAFGTIPAPGVAVTVDISQPDDGAVWQGRGVTGQNGQLVLVVPPGWLSVVGKKGDKTYNGFAYDQGSNNTASIDLFNYAPPLAPPPAPPPDPDPELISIELIVAAGNASGETAFLIVEDASSLIEAGFESNVWAVAETGFDLQIIDVVGNTLELNFPVDLTEFGLIEGATVTLVSYD